MGSLIIFKNSNSKGMKGQISSQDFLFKVKSLREGQKLDKLELCLT